MEGVIVTLNNHIRKKEKQIRVFENKINLARGEIAEFKNQLTILTPQEENKISPPVPVPGQPSKKRKIIQKIGDVAGKNVTYNPTKETSSKGKEKAIKFREAADVRNNIPTTKQKEQHNKISLAKFQSIWQTIVNYSEIPTTMHNFYPKIRAPLNIPKSIILPNAEPNLVWEHFAHGFTDTIYIKDHRILDEFPPKVAAVVNRYSSIFARGREIFLRTHSSYPIFGRGSALVLPSITIARMGISHGNYPSRDELVNNISLEAKAKALADVFFTSHKISSKDKVRINYVSKTLIIYSITNQVIDNEGLKALAEFEEPFYCFEKEFGKIPEIIQKSLCKEMAALGTHQCRHCDDEERMMRVICGV